jgi:alcohol dehydrogenase
MQYHMPSRLYFGPGQIQELSTLITAKNPVLVTDKGVVKAGLAAPVLNQLGKMPVFDSIEANPKSDTINKIAGELRQQKPDLVIGLGGGSPLDAGKALALLATNPGNIQDYEGKEKYAVDPLPFVAIPTTCGTGSEVTWVSVITDVDRKFKMSIKGPKLYPTVSIVDPDLIATLPAPMIAATGLDALTHAVEAYLAKPATLITDTHAVKAVGLILGSMKRRLPISGTMPGKEKISCTVPWWPAWHSAMPMSRPCTASPSPSVRCMIFPMGWPMPCFCPMFWITTCRPAPGKWQPWPGPRALMRYPMTRRQKCLSRKSKTCPGPFKFQRSRT